jgi:poly-gamma-glutamate capsule biosynthesis protein CapA/YwtB (metallophosphatase superfamily)
MNPNIIACLARAQAILICPGVAFKACFSVVFEHRDQLIAEDTAQDTLLGIPDLERSRGEFSQAKNVDDVVIVFTSALPTALISTTQRTVLCANS